MCTLQLFLQYICLAIGTWKWWTGLPSRRYFFSHQFIVKTISTSGEGIRNEAKGTLLEERTILQITLKRGGKVRQNMTYKTKIVIFGKKKTSRRKGNWAGPANFLSWGPLHTGLSGAVIRRGGNIKVLAAQNNILCHLQRRQFPVWNLEAPRNTSNSPSKRKKEYATKRQFTGSKTIFFSF